mgnify:CR=1 FL=1
MVIHSYNHKKPSSFSVLCLQSLLNPIHRLIITLIRFLFQKSLPNKLKTPQGDLNQGSIILYPPRYLNR